MQQNISATIDRSSVVCEAKKTRLDGYYYSVIQLSCESTTKSTQRLKTKTLNEKSEKTRAKNISKIYVLVCMKFYINHNVNSCD